MGATEMTGLVSSCVTGGVLVWGLVVGYAGVAGVAIWWDAVRNRALGEES